jgi:hypothetical protein
MKLADLRRLSIKQKTRICFPLPDGLECVITEHGIAQVPGLRAIPRFNLENELAAAREFRLEPAGELARKHPRPPRSLSRDEVALLLDRPSATPLADREDD